MRAYVEMTAAVNAFPCRPSFVGSAEDHHIAAANTGHSFGGPDTVPQAYRAALQAETRLASEGKRTKESGGFGAPNVPSELSEDRIRTGQRRRIGRRSAEVSGGRRFGDALRVGVTRRQGKRSGGVLAARIAAGRADVLIHLVRSAVHDPDIAGIARIERDARRIVSPESTSRVGRGYRQATGAVFPARADRLCR